VSADCRVKSDSELSCRRIVTPRQIVRRQIVGRRFLDISCPAQARDRLIRMAANTRVHTVISLTLLFRPCSIFGQGNELIFWSVSLIV